MINLGSEYRKLVPPWIRPWLPADATAPAGDGGSSSDGATPGEFYDGGLDGGSSSEEYGEWSQSQSQAGAGALDSTGSVGPAKRPREAEAGAGGKRQRQEE